MTASTKSWDRSDPPNARLGSVTKQIYRLLADAPQGLDITQIRGKLGVGEDQEHLDRRIRDLRKYYEVPGVHEGSRYVYKLVGLRQGVSGDGGSISGRLRAEVLHLAKGRCQMCGRTIANDDVRLQADHKIPQNWGGKTVLENLWAICDACNNGKRDYFSSFDDDRMEEIMALESVHERLAHLLKLHMGKPVSSRLLEFVANATERQEDWHKRLRELRYPVIGLEITMERRRNERGYTESQYTLHNWRDFPPDFQRQIRAWEGRNKAVKPRP